MGWTRWAEISIQKREVQRHYKGRVPAKKGKTNVDWRLSSPRPRMLINKQEKEKVPSVKKKKGVGAFQSSFKASNICFSG